MAEQNSELLKCKVKIIQNVSDDTLLASYDSDILYFVTEES